MTAEDALKFQVEKWRLPAWRGVVGRGKNFGVRRNLAGTSRRVAQKNEDPEFDQHVEYSYNHAAEDNDVHDAQ